MHSVVFVLITVASGFALVTNAPRTHTMPAAPSEAADGDRRECPGHELFIKPDSGPPITQISVAGIYSNVPEMHDCQRFIVKGSYGSLFAVYSSQRLDSLDEDLEQLNGQRVGGGTTREGVPLNSRMVVAAEVHSSEGTYKRLGIKPGFNCLYLTSLNGWRTAYIVPTGHVTQCARNVTAAELANNPRTTALYVQRVQYANYLDRDYPAVARWVQSGTRYLAGLKCGDAWCVVGVDQADAGPVARAGVTALATDAQRKLARVGTIPGWNDEQTLAIPSIDIDEGANPVQPSTFRARVMPDADLGQKNLCSDFTTWQTAGTIEFRGVSPHYESKLGLTQGSNRLMLKCISDMVWEAKIINGANVEKVLKVERWTHQQLKGIPGTLRWRWQANDETIWARCLEGCCQVVPT